MRIKLVISTISTGIVLGLLALLVWFASFRMLPSTAQVDKTKNEAIAVIAPSKEMDVSQINFGQQIETYILPNNQANYLPIRDFNIPDPDIGAKSAALYDIKSEKLLYSKDVNDKLPIASITKLMTAVVVMENLSLSDTYTVVPEDLNADGNGADFANGEKLKGGDLLKVMLIKSSNDAALVFASNASQKGIDIVAKMNEKAGVLGMADTKFSDPAGLDDGDSFSTVSDLIKLVGYVDKYPVIWEILATRTADVSSIDGKYTHHLVSTDQLLGDVPGIIGGKTGFTNGALQTMVLEVKVSAGDTTPAGGQGSISGGDDNRMIAVVLGSNDRFGEIKELVEWGRQAYSWQ
ncbi:MAG: serine hydrolase [Minisyncoccia bacterium]